MVYIAIELLKGFLSEQCFMQCHQLQIEDLSSQRPFYSKPPAVPFHPFYDNQRNNSYGMKQQSEATPAFRNSSSGILMNGFNGQQRPTQLPQPGYPMKRAPDLNKDHYALTETPANHGDNRPIVPVEPATPKVKSELVSVSKSNGIHGQSAEDSINWPMNMEIQVNVLHKRVKVLGIHTGYALVTILDSIKPSSYIECSSFDSGIPGDFLLW